MLLQRQHQHRLFRQKLDPSRIQDSINGDRNGVDQDLVHSPSSDVCKRRATGAGDERDEWDIDAGYAE